MKKQVKKAIDYLQSNKQTIYWDVDDVILNSTGTIINMINEKYNKPNGLEYKTESDLKDWGYKSINNEVTSSEVCKMFDSEEFWANVEIRTEFYTLVESGILSKYNNVFITKGTETNLSLKKKYLYETCELKEVFNKFKFIGLGLEDSKANVNMAGAIQIDDNFNYLKDTNAKIKILMKNHSERSYNNSFSDIDTLDNLYNVNDLNDVWQILDFNVGYGL